MRPTYSAAAEEVPIWMAVPRAVRKHARRRAGRRPYMWEKGPAKRVERREPRVRKEESSCWKVCCCGCQLGICENGEELGELTPIPYPPGALGSGYPKTLRKPGIACRAARQALSRPYCMLARETRAQMKRHLLLIQSEVSGSLSTVGLGEPSLSLSFSFKAILRVVS